MALESAPAKPLSQSQLDANRRNAQKSTGPRTPEGKAKSRENALKHGLSSRRTVLACENLAEFQQLHSDLIKGFAPANPQESMLVAQVAKCYWSLTRAQAIECSTFELGIEHVKREKHHPNPADLSEDFKALGYALLAEDESHLMNYFRYARAADNAFHRALANLRTMQNDRLKREQLSSPAVGEIDSAGPLKTRTAGASPASVENAVHAVERAALAVGFVAQPSKSSEAAKGAGLRAVTTVLIALVLSLCAVRDLTGMPQVSGNLVLARQVTGSPSGIGA